MLVGKRMFSNIVTINPEDKVSYAFELMKSNQIRHLPVVEGKKLVGIVTDRDIRQIFVPKQSLYSKKIVKYQMADLQVREIMTPKPITVTPQTSIEDATLLIIKYKIGGLPVVEGEELVGIITDTDVLNVFVEIMGIIGASSRIDVVLGESPRAFEDVSKIIKSQGVDIISVGMSGHPDKKDRIYYFRVESCDTNLLAEKIRNAGYQIDSVLS